MTSSNIVMIIDMIDLLFEFLNTNKDNCRNLFVDFRFIFLELGIVHKKN